MVQHSSSQSCHQSDPILIGQVVNETSLQERSDCSDTFLNASFVCSSRALRVSCSSRSPSSYGRNSRRPCLLVYCMPCWPCANFGSASGQRQVLIVGSDVPHAFRFYRSSVQLFGLRGDVRYLGICPSYKPTESDSGKSLIV